MDVAWSKWTSWSPPYAYLRPDFLRQGRYGLLGVTVWLVNGACCFVRSPSRTIFCLNILVTEYVALFRVKHSDCALTQIPEYTFLCTTLRCTLVCLTPGASRWSSAVTATQIRLAPSIRCGHGFSPTSSHRRGDCRSRLRPWNYEPTPFAVALLSCWYIVLLK